MTTTTGPTTERVTESDDAIVSRVTGVGGDVGDRATEAVERVTETPPARTFEKAGLGGMMVREALRTVPSEFHQIALDALPERFTESELRDQVGVVWRVIEGKERHGMLGGRSVSGSQVSVGAEHADKQRERLAATFRGDYSNGFRRVSEAYAEITGRPYEPMTDRRASEFMAATAAGFIEGARVTESLDSTSWGDALADVMRKHLVDLYQGGTWSEWRKVVTISAPRDFRTQKLVQVAEFASLPIVGEGAPYQPLTSVEDTQATYAVTKKGGTEDYTYEMAKNDDLRALTQIPQRLARIAAYTLYATIFDVFTANAAITSGDGLALFHNSHGNTTSVTLSQAGLATVRRNMRDQTAYGDTERVMGLTPRYLLVPNELEEIGYQLTTGRVAVPSTPAGPSDTPNIHADMEAIVVDRWTSADTWYVTSDPAEHPLIEVGFLDGKEDPELFVQDDPTQGSAFSADKVTWKLRHIWGYGVVDYRGFQRGTA